MEKPTRISIPPHFLSRYRLVGVSINIQFQYLFFQSLEIVGTRSQVAPERLQFIISQEHRSHNTNRGGSYHARFHGVSPQSTHILLQVHFQTQLTRIQIRLYTASRWCVRTCSAYATTTMPIARPSCTSGR